MTAKEYLLQIMDFDAVIAEDLQELERLRKQKTEIRTVRYDQEKVDMSRNDGKDPLLTAIENIADYEQKLATDEILLVSKRIEIIKMIQGMPNKVYSDLLYQRYVNGNTLKEIADKSKFQQKTIINQHGAALASFSKQYGFPKKLSD